MSTSGALFLLIEGGESNTCKYKNCLLSGLALEITSYLPDSAC